MRSGLTSHCSRQSSAACAWWHLLPPCSAATLCRCEYDLRCAVTATTDSEAATLLQQILERIEKIEAELAELRELVERLEVGT